MRDDRQRKSRLVFVEDEQAGVSIPKSSQAPGEMITRPKNPPAVSRLQLTKEELGDPKLEKSMRKVEQAAKKLDKAKARIPKQKAMAIARATDEATGKTTYRLSFEEKAKPPSRLMHETLPSLTGEVHRQIHETEEENVGVQAVHGTEQGAESAYRFADHSRRAQKLKAHRAAEKAEQRLDNANIRLLQKQEPLSSNPVSRWQQKRAIRNAYMTEKVTMGNAGSKTMREGVSTAADRVKMMVAKNKKPLGVALLITLLLVMIMNGLQACAPLVQTGLQAIAIATYPAEDADILAAERAYRAMEDELQNEVNNYPYFHPEYDEYQYELDEIWHDPHVLISLISARIGDEWTIDDVYGTLGVLFERQYTLTQTITSETRYRKEWVTHYEKKTNPDTGAVTWVPYDVLEDVPYTYRICTVTLKNFDLSHLPFYVLSREGVGRYAMYISVHGNRDDLFWGNPHAAPLRDYTRHDIPEEYLEDETFARIIEEAKKYLGYPYVWGGDSPETSFDCSGFVSYVFTNSGVRNVGRLGATSLYGACQKITPEQAKPGDLIFFEGTIPGETGISHVGIYVGDGWMIHCGKPVGYQRLDDSYYKQHYFGWGRLAN